MRKSGRNFRLTSVAVLRRHGNGLLWATADKANKSGEGNADLGKSDVGRCNFVDVVVASVDCEFSIIFSKDVFEAASP